MVDCRDDRQLAVPGGGVARYAVDGGGGDADFGNDGQIRRCQYVAKNRNRVAAGIFS